jgi:hypothetical protein
MAKVPVSSVTAEPRLAQLLPLQQISTEADGVKALPATTAPLPGAPAEGDTDMAAANAGRASVTWVRSRAMTRAAVSMPTKTRPGD